MRLQSVHNNIRLNKSPHFLIRSKKENLFLAKEPKEETSFRHNFRCHKLDATKLAPEPIMLINHISQSDRLKGNLYRIQLLKKVKRLEFVPHKSAMQSFF